MNILVVDDEKLKLVTLERQLSQKGHSVHTAGEAYEGIGIFEREQIDVAIADIRMPRMNGLDFLREIKRRDPEAAVIVMTAYGSIETAVEAMRLGAFDYITKPFSIDELAIRLDRLAEFRRAREENLRLQHEVRGRYRFDNIVGRSEVMRAVMEKVATVAETDSTVMIQGESGTGKELIASAIHYNSRRSRGPLIKVGCAILSREVLESELFGHERGAFTGAFREKKGRFELAHGGTIFLDDVDDIPLDLQVKLLRVLDQMEFERVGGERPVKVDVRVLCSSKKDLGVLARKGLFRDDLFYRLNVIRIILPPVRARLSDVPLLAEYFARVHAGASPPKAIGPRAMDALARYSWPGNVRELKNAVEHALTFSKGNSVDVEDFPPEVREGRGDDLPVMANLDHVQKLNLPDVLNRLERDLIEWASLKAGGNCTKMAELLGVPRTTLRDKIAKHDLPYAVSDD